MGGAAKAALQSVKSAPKTGPAGMQGFGQAMGPGPKGAPPPQLQFMADKLRGNPGMPPPVGPSQMQFMADKLRGNPGMPPTVSGAQAKGMGLGQAMGGNPQMAQNLGKVAGATTTSTRSRTMGGMPPPPPAGPVKMQGLGQAMGGNPQMAQNLGKVAGAAMGGMGMKSGGTVSASKRADGCAVKGKTKGRMV